MERAQIACLTHKNRRTSTISVRKAPRAPTQAQKSIQKISFRALTLCHPLTFSQVSPSVFRVEFLLGGPRAKHQAKSGKKRKMVKFWARCKPWASPTPNLQRLPQSTRTQSLLTGPTLPTSTSPLEKQSRCALSQSCRQSITSKRPKTWWVPFPPTSTSAPWIQSNLQKTSRAPTRAGVSTTTRKTSKTSWPNLRKKKTSIPRPVRVAPARIRLRALKYSKSVIQRRSES